MSESKKKRVLVLNGGSALGTIGWKRAMRLIYCDENDIERVTPIKYYDSVVLGAGGVEYPLPAVVVKNHYVKRKTVPYNRINVFTRDSGICQYCGFCDGTYDDLTIDHVVPRATWKKKKFAGSPTVWTNVVTACKKCNHYKADRTPKEADMPLMNVPREPSPYEDRYIASLSPWSYIQPEWEDWIPPLYKELREIRNGNQ